MMGWGGRDLESKQAKEIEVNAELITLSFSPGFYDLSFWGQPFPEAGRESTARGCEMEARSDGEEWLIF